MVWPQAGIGEIADPDAHQGATGNGLHWDHLFGLEQALHRRQGRGVGVVQLVAIFGTGLLYGWLRLDSGSTVPPVIAHILFNAVIYLAAVFF